MTTMASQSTPMPSVGNSIFFLRKYALFSHLIVKFHTVTGLFWCKEPKLRTVTDQISEKIYGRNTIAHTAYALIIS